jgi:HPt (histidine-containing phosphotransfer) domain-containing protein
MIESHLNQEDAAGSQLKTLTPVDGVVAEFSSENLNHTQPKLNLDALVIRCGGDYQLVESLAEMFPPEALKLLHNVELAQTHRDLRGLQLAAHTLKGMCSMFDAAEATEAALELEMAAASSGFGSGAQLESLQIEVHRAINMVSEIKIQPRV